MVMPINCPLCNHALLNSFSQSSFMLAKSCKNILNHKFHCTTLEPFEHIIYLLIEKNNMSYEWYFGVDSRVIISTTQKNSIKTIASIPWIEPDFNNIKNSLNRINNLLPLL